MFDRMIAATDGAAQPNPGWAGWAWVLVEDEGLPCYGQSGYLGWTTNNVAELTAVIQVLEATDAARPMEIRVDSEYAKNAVARLPNQRARGYRTRAGKPVKNRELIEHLDALLTDRDVVLSWVAAHQEHGDLLNAEADHAAELVAAEGSGRSWTGPVCNRSNLAAPVHERRRCQASTRTGTPCPNEPRASDMCHLHDPDVQCGARTSSGGQCGIATGGGRCNNHRHQLF